ncbi:hypothetical protein E4U21_007913 [Claviceps maximensis]|nr:hypothetical protein E4U21_007913 [Claviceps maximensis]
MNTGNGRKRPANPRGPSHGGPTMTTLVTALSTTQHTQAELSQCEASFLGGQERLVSRGDM